MSILSRNSTILRINEATIDKKIEDSGGGGGGSLNPTEVIFSNTNLITVNHSLGRAPASVMIYDESGDVLNNGIDIDIIDGTRFTVTSNTNISGKLLYI